MKILIAGVLIAIISIYLLLNVWKPVRLQTYLLPSNLELGWVVIEYDNIKCPSLKEGGWWRELTIPESGYLCTSSPIEIGWTYNMYYLVDAQRERTRLTESEHIFAPSSMHINEASCKIVAELFKYGSGKATNERTAFVEEYHPECRNRGVPTTSLP